jgi:site-specific recombinase XerD
MADGTRTSRGTACVAPGTQRQRQRSGAGVGRGARTDLRPISPADVALIDQHHARLISGGKSLSYAHHVAKALRSLARHVEGRGLLSVTTDDVTTWLAHSNGSRDTLTKYRLELDAFYGPVTASGLISANPVAPLRERRRRPVDSTTAGLLDGWALHQRRRNLSPVTIDHRRLRVLAFAEWLANQHGVGLLAPEVTADVIEQHLDDCHVAADTRRTYLSFLRAFYAWAVGHDLTQTNPTRRCVVPRKRVALPRPIATRDLRVAMTEAEASDPRMAAWLALAAYAGLRCSEIARLRAQDVGVDVGALFVHQGKGRRDRTVPLNPALRRALQGYGVPARGLVFTRARDGGAIQPSTVSRYISRFLEELGIHATAHQLRHWYATEVYDKSGGDLLLTQQLLGHASPATTAVYAAVSKPKAAAVVTRLSVEEHVQEE